MHSFLIVLPFTPVIIGLLWIYTSNMTRLKGYIRVLIRVPLYCLIFWSVVEQENYLSQHEALHVRGFYEATLLLVDVVPIFLVLIYQSRRNPEMMRVSARGKAFTEQEREKDLQEDVRVLQTTYLADGSLRAEVLPPRNQAAYKLLATALVIAISVVAVNQFFVARQMALLPSSPRIAFYRFIQIMVSLASAYIVAKVLTGREVLTMSRRELRVQHVLLGITGSSRNFETRNLTNLRFAQWQVASSNGLKNRSGLSFQVGATVETFGTALTKTQVDDLISKMRAVSVS